MSEYRDELQKLFTAGKPSSQYDVKANHLRDFSLTLEDVPALIAIVMENSKEEFEEPKSWSAVHAWRALAQLKAKEAIPTFIEVLERDVWEDWGWEELPEILGQFGVDAFDSVYQSLLKHRGGFEVGLILVSTLNKIAEADENLIEPIKTVMIELLSEPAKNDEGVNGNLISYLTDFKAVEALSTIEKAYAGNYVDTMICGDWDDVQVEFGLKDPSELPPKPSFFDFLQDATPFLDVSIDTEKSIQKKKSKKQMAKKSKQINRRKKKKK